jgi:hypothetical protein
MKEKRQAEVAAEKEKARLEKEEKRKSKDGKPGRFTAFLGKDAAGAAGAAVVSAGAAGVSAGATAEVIPTTAEEARPGTAETNRSAAVEHEAGETDLTSPGREDATQEEPQSPEPPSPDAEAKKEPVSPAPVSPDEVTSPKGDSRVKSWFKSRFRSTSKTQADLDESPATVGNATTATATKAEADDGKARSDSMRDMETAQGQLLSRHSEKRLSQQLEIAVPRSVLCLPPAKISLQSSSKPVHCPSNPSQERARQSRRQGCQQKVLLQKTWSPTVNRADARDSAKSFFPRLSETRTRTNPFRKNSESIRQPSQSLLSRRQTRRTPGLTRILRRQETRLPKKHLPLRRSWATFQGHRVARGREAGSPRIYEDRCTLIE